MRIALCFYGESRYVNETYPYILDKLISGNDVDVFMHTWENKDYQQAIELYSPISYETEPPKNFDYKKTLSSNLYQDNFLHQIYSVTRVCELKKAYERENHFAYDLVIHTRFDLVPDNKICFTDILKNKINICGYRYINKKYIDCAFIITNSELFDKFFNMWDNIDHYLTEENARNYNEPHAGFFGEGSYTFFADYFEVYPFINKTSQLDWTICRGNNYIKV